jgi:hypothetical protein
MDLVLPSGSTCVFDCPRCEDDLTHKLVEIIRANVALRRMITNGSPQHILNEYVSLLQVSPGVAVHGYAGTGSNAVWGQGLQWGCQVFRLPLAMRAVGCCMHAGVRVPQACAPALVVSHMCRYRARSADVLFDRMCCGNTPLPACCCVQFHVVTYMDNTIPGVNPATQRSGRPIKSISQVRAVCTQQVVVLVCPEELHCVAGVGKNLVFKA